MGIKLLAMALSAVMLVIVLELSRREKLSFKYAMGWMFISIVGFILAVFDKWIYQWAKWFGFELPSNFIFFTLQGIFVFIMLLLTVFLCQQNNRNDAMAQKIALLELEIEELKSLQEKSDNKKSA